MGMDDENMLRRIAAMYPLYTPVRGDRNLEWWTSIAKIILGLWLMLPADTVSQWVVWNVPWFSEMWLGVAILVAGLAEGTMLIINGSRDWTPAWRGRVLTLSLVPLGALLVVTATDEMFGLGVPLAVFFIVRTLICIRRAAEDATHVEARRDVGIHH